MPKLSKVDRAILSMRSAVHDREFCVIKTWSGPEGGKRRLQEAMREELGYVDHDRVSEVLLSLGPCRHSGGCTVDITSDSDDADWWTH